MVTRNILIVFFTPSKFLLSVKNHSFNGHRSYLREDGMVRLGITGGGFVNMNRKIFSS